LAQQALEQRTLVVIVGAGPAGLVVAHRLLLAGVPCLVFERDSKTQLLARTKAGMIEHRTVQALAPYGLAAPILERGSTNRVVEFRFEGAPYVFDYGALTGGLGHFVYPQHLLVQDWIAAYEAAGGALQFSTEVVGLERLSGSPGDAVFDAHRARVWVRSAAGQYAVDCRAVVVAAGANAELGFEGIETYEHAHPFRWLATMLEAPPLGERTVYALHRRGFSAHLRRSAELTRYYLEVPLGDGVEDWPDERLRAELSTRLGVPEARLLGRFLERAVLSLRVQVREPLQQGCVYLTGDAAHLITPAGGKGMNLAIQDSLELAEGLIDHLARGSPQRLQEYSERRLPVIWRYQEFSQWLVTLYSGGVLAQGASGPTTAAQGAAQGAVLGSSFARRLQRAQLERLFADPAFARWFAHRYAGVDES
jgi:p-hydroxybenzoate 3-monooxygenase